MEFCNKVSGMDIYIAKRAPISVEIRALQTKTIINQTNPMKYEK